MSQATCLVCGKALSRLLHYCSDEESDHDGVGCAFCSKATCWACIDKEEGAQRAPHTKQKLAYLEGVLYLGAPDRFKECEFCGIRMCQSCIGEAFTGSCAEHFVRRKKNRKTKRV